MKKFLLSITCILLSPVVLFLVLTMILYIPSVQNFIVQKVAAYMSEATGAEVSVGHVALKFPLDLSIEEAKFVKRDSLTSQRDTIADVNSLVADVELWPLMKGRVVVDEFCISKAKFDTDGFIASVRVKGDVQTLKMKSRAIDLKRETVELNDMLLKGSDFDIELLPDTLSEDTTKSEAKWIINVSKAKIADTKVTLRTIGDTLNIAAAVGGLDLTNTHIDLGNARYEMERLAIAKSTITYDDTTQPKADGLDYNHLALDDVNIEIDSMFYQDPNAQLILKKLSMKEKSGIAITQMTMPLKLDSAKIDVPQLLLCTDHSRLTANCTMDLNAFDKRNPGKISIGLDATIGKQDVMLFAGPMPKDFVLRYPEQPLSLKASAYGNLRRVELTSMDLNLPKALSVTAKGYAFNPLETERMKAKANLKAQTGNLDFVTCLLPAKTRKAYRLPAMSLTGQLSADGQKYGADLLLAEGKGKVTLKGTYNAPDDSYRANLSVTDIDLRHFMPRDSLKLISGNVALNGRGFDVLSSRTRMEATAKVSKFGYGHMNIDNISLKALLEKGVAHAKLESENAMLDGEICFDALVSTKKLQATLSTDLKWADMQMMRISEKPLAVSLCAHVDMASNLKEAHKLEALLNDLTIRTSKKTYRPEDLVMDILTNRDTTRAHIYSGNLELDFAAQGGYESLVSQAGKIADELTRHQDELIIDGNGLRELLPVMSVHLRSGNDNPVSNFLRFNGIDFKQLSLDLKSSPAEGLQSQGHIYSLVYDSLRIDTIRYDISQDDQRLNFTASVQNNKRNPQLVFRTLFNGYLEGNKAGLSAKFYDGKEQLGIDASVKAEMSDSGICVRLEPYKQLLGYKSFNINDDNFLFFARNNRISSKLDLIADDGTGLKMYSEDSDPDMLQDLTVSLNKLDLGRLSDVIPYMPHIGGLLNGDYHVMLDKDQRLSLVSDMSVQNMTYEHSPMGNIGSEFVYLQGEGSAHRVEALFTQNDKLIGQLNGTYYDDETPRIDATFEMKETPLDLVNGFVPDQLLGLEGTAEGKLSITGTTSRPDVNGEIYLNSSYLVSVPYGMRLRFDNDPVRIVGSKLLLENFTVYAHNDNPLNIMGQVDFSNLERIMVDLRMRARDYQIIGEKENNKSVAYGKAYVNVDGTIKGLIDNLVMKGKLDVLGKTDMGYILRDSPLTTDNHLDELVKFRDFTDTTTTNIQRPQITGFTMDMSLNVSNGAHIMAYLNADHSNYIDLTGGGNLRMQYNVMDGIMLNGRYTLSNGKMKYSLPIIPLKTFTIQDGSYLEFHGDVMNPQLNITAEEEKKATVTGTNGVGRSVKFICGIMITRTLQNMGLEFTLDAPEDLTLHNELQNMSIEQRGKLAVTMLTTGMYLADGNTESFSMNNALSSFLNSEINQITGSALRTLDLSFGIDNSTNEQGGIHTDYSFQFAKRFWNNRLKISIGGKVSTGASVQSQQNRSFFDNVTFEYRLDDTANKYVTLFYNNNAYDWLDGYTQEYGAGFVWKKTIQNFRDLFRKDDFTAMPDSSATPRKEAIINE